jgi:hypothetical protein
MHGQGILRCNEIAVSLEGFGLALAALAQAGRGREVPIALENNPLTQSEREATLAEIRRHNPGIDLDFWENILS